MASSRVISVIVSVAAVTAAMAVVATSAGTAEAAPHAAAAPSVAGPATDKVIVVLKDEVSALPATPAMASRRASALAVTQAPLVDAVRRAGGRSVKQFRVLNGFAATVSSGEAAALARDSRVAEVLPDSPISPPADVATIAGGRAGATAAASGAVANVCQGAKPGQVQLNPQATVLTHSDSDVPGALTARSLGYTGTGVKVGLIAEGIDVNNPDFIRPDGTHVITDYQDFSGDGTNAPTNGDEAFLDATSIGAQGRKVYDVSHFSALPLSKPCLIRIEGVAPGASIVALKIFAANDANTFSNALQAIDYAVGVDHVNIMNESYGLVPYPDDDLNALDQLNDQIIRAGVTVVASSGDSGVTNAIWSPSTDPNLISVGATTAYRFDLQTGYAFSRGAHATGWVDNNISSLSSGGVSQAERSVDLVAPGELDFGLCTASAQYTGCVNYAGEPSDVEAIGGTSQSGPVVAGAAALVIEAYRHSHGGDTPSPAVVKQILTSTADDIDAPSVQQGAGILDSYKAVQAALSYPGATTARTGQTLLTSTNHVTVSARPGTGFTRAVTVTNDGVVAQGVSLSSRALGTYHQIAAATRTLSDTASPHAIDFQGLPDNVEKVRFTVPAGTDRLDTRIAWQAASTALAARVRMTLIDPRGRLVGYSLPQGIGNYGDSQVAAPVPGTWTAYLTARTSANGGTTGPVVFGAFAARWQRAGAVSPAHLNLAPGASGVVHYVSTVPNQPGDTAASIVLTATHGAPSRVTTIPVVVRSELNLTAARQQFTDTITGPNGRTYASSVGRFFDLTVPAGTPEINVDVHEAVNGNPFLAYLVSPQGEGVASTSSDLIDGDNLVGVPGGQLHVLHPVAGTWRLIITFGPIVKGTALSLRYSVAFDGTPDPVVATGLPNSAHVTLARGQARTARVTFRNNGRSPEAVFVDARLNRTTTYALALGATSLPLPNTTASAATYILPTRTTSMTTSVSSTEPVSYDVSFATGYPDFIGVNSGNSSTGTATGNPIAPGIWFLVPSAVGPYGTGPGPAATATMSASARTAAFDPAISCATGDLWLQSIDASATVAPVVVRPGASVTLPITITPGAAVGSVVRGTLLVDQMTSVGTPYSEYLPGGNEVTELRYTYTVG